MDKLSASVPSQTSLQDWQKNPSAPTPYQGIAKRFKAKRVLDVVLSSLLVIGLLPLLAVLVVVLFLSQGRPILFRQARHGQNKTVFTLYKFRTMLGGDDFEGCAPQTSPTDPRLTPLGRWLRRLSLDELPQLFNVLTGDMSLVGPRPHAVAHDHAFAHRIEGYDQRFAALPGLTGLAQMRGLRGAIVTERHLEQRLSADLEYIERQSLWLDLAILLRTALVVPFQRAAF